MRCFTVLLACGWLLFSPPVSGNNEVKSDEALQLWEHVASYDTAGQCEKEKRSTIELRMLLMVKSGAKSGDDKKLDAQLLGAMKMRCVPSDALGFKFK